MKLFALKMAGETEAVAAETKESALSFYKESTGMTEEEMELESVGEIAPETWETIKVVNEDRQEGEPEYLTVKEMMEGVTEPCLIFTTVN